MLGKTYNFLTFEYILYHTTWNQIVSYFGALSAEEQTFCFDEDPYFTDYDAIDEMRKRGGTVKVKKGA